MTRVCPRGHEARIGKRCLVCRRATQARYERTEKGRATWRRYRKTAKGQNTYRGVCIRWYRRNAEARRRKIAAYYKANRDTILARRREKYAETIRRFGSVPNAFWAGEIRRSA